MPFEYYFAIKYFIIALAVILIVSLFKRKQKKNPWRYKDVIYLFSLHTFFYLIYALFLPSLGDLYLSNQVPKLLSYHIYKIVPFLIDLIPISIFYFVKKDLTLNDLYIFIKNKKDIFWGIGIGILGAIYTAFRIFRTQLLYDQLMPGKKILGSMPNLNLYPLYFVLYYIIFSLFEEIYCRGILIPTFEEKFSTKVSVFLSVIIFSLFHGLKLHHWIFIINIFIPGLLYSWLFVRRRTIIPSFIAHSIMNISTGIKYLLAEGIIENPLL